MTESATTLGVLERPEMPETGEHLHRRLYEALRQLARGRMA